MAAGSFETDSAYLSWFAEIFDRHQLHDRDDVGCAVTVRVRLFHRAQDWRAGTVLLLMVCFYPITLGKLAVFTPCCLLAWCRFRQSSARASLLFTRCLGCRVFHVVKC